MGLYKKVCFEFLPELSTFREAISNTGMSVFIRCPDILKKVKQTWHLSDVSVFALPVVHSLLRLLNRHSYSSKVYPRLVSLPGSCGKTKKKKQWSEGTFSPRECMLSGAIF